MGFESFLEKQAKKMPIPPKKQLKYKGHRVYHKMY